MFVAVLLHNSLVDNGTIVSDNESNLQSMHGIDCRKESW
jgi:hypothetical protein